MKISMKQRVLMALMNRYVLVIFNFILIGIILSIIHEVTTLVITPENDTKEMVHMCNGIAVILYGYGVAMEFRAPIMKILGLYPAFIDQLQEGTDDICHTYGIYFLLLGLAQEILVHLVIMPSRVLVLKTAGTENFVFAICSIIQVIVTLLLFRLTVLLFGMARKVRQEKSQIIDVEEG
jgi:hypothetical protein